jgi:hypothetical protein
MSGSALSDALTTATTLISHLQSTLRENADELVSSQHAKDGNPLNPLALASTAATLIKAQTTKLTLLSLNKPFSPKVLSDILTSLTNSPLPALVTAAQICVPEKYGLFTYNWLRNSSIALLSALEKLLEEIPTTAAAQDELVKLGKGNSKSQQDAFKGTGVVWSTCDEFVALGKGGIGDAAAQKMQGWRELLNDAIEELVDWIETKPEADEDDEELSNELKRTSIKDKEKASSVQGLNSRPSSPNSSTDSLGFHLSPEIIPVAKHSIALLKHVQLLFPPIIKRRLKRFPDFKAQTEPNSIPPINQLQRLDKISQAGEKLSHYVDDVAGSLYENEEDEVQKYSTQLLETARTLIEDATLAWDGGDDEFTKWVPQWTKKLAELEAKN